MWRRLLLVLGLGTLVLLAGCQSANGIMAAQADGLCPACQAQTRTMPLTGQDFTVHSCPGCRRVSVLDKATQDAVERAFGGQAGDTIHQCDYCSNPSDCPVCRREMT
jgi:hypothetical protein